MGTVTANGMYTAPSPVTQQRTAWVAAASVADPTRTGNVSITLLPPTGTVAVNVNTTIEGVSVPVTLSGTGYNAGSYTAPAFLSWVPGASCSVAFATPVQSGPGTRYVFQEWLDNGSSANPRTIAAPPAAAEYIAEYTAQHKLTLGTVPSGAGTFSIPTGQYYNESQIVAVTVTPAACYAFSGWSPNAPGGNVTMDGPQTVLANFVRTCP